MVEPFMRHWLLVALLEVRVTLPPAQNVVGPPAEMVGVAGAANTLTFVVTGSEVQPLAVTVSEYVPASATLAFARVGFCSEEVKPFGPVHAYVAPLMNDAKSEIVEPSQYGPKL